MKTGLITLIITAAVLLGLAWASPYAYVYALDDALQAEAKRQPSSVVLDDVMAVPHIVDSVQVSIGSHMDAALHNEEERNPFVALAKPFLQKLMEGMVETTLTRDAILSLFDAHQGLSLAQVLGARPIELVSFKHAQWQYEDANTLLLSFPDLPRNDKVDLDVTRTFVIQRTSIFWWKMVDIRLTKPAKPTTDTAIST